MRIEILNKTQPLQSMLFHLDEGEEVPLHDHPDTHVFLYVLSGKLEMACFDLLRQQSQSIFIKPTFTQVFEAKAHLLLTPSTNNLHRLKALSPVSFLDVFTPGYYENQSEPNWYKVVDDTDANCLEATLTEQPDDLATAKARALEAFSTIQA